MDKMMRLLQAVKAVASMREPSVEKLLRSRGFGFEANRMKEMVDAFDAIEPFKRPELPPAPATCNIAYLVGSSRTCHIDLVTGEVTPPYEFDPEQPLIALTKVDLIEYEIAWGHRIMPDEDVDVLDVAGWNTAGAWIPAEEDFRDSHAEACPDNEDVKFYAATGRGEARRYTRTIEAAQREAA